jgi:hypothetical protein
MPCVNIIGSYCDSSDELRSEAKKQANGADPDADEGWVQTLITRIAANVSLELRGLTIKYAEV